MDENYQRLHSLYDKLIQKSDEAVYCQLKAVLRKCSCDELDYIELQLKTALLEMQEGFLVQSVIPIIVSIAAMLLSIFSVLSENISTKELRYRQRSFKLPWRSRSGFRICYFLAFSSARRRAISS